MPSCCWAASPRPSVTKYVSAMPGVKIGLSQSGERDIWVRGLNRAEERGNAEYYVCFIICAPCEMFAVLKDTKYCAYQMLFRCDNCGAEKCLVAKPEGKRLLEDLVVEGSII